MHGRGVGRDLTGVVNAMKSSLEVKSSGSQI